MAQTNHHGGKDRVIVTVKVLLEEIYILMARDSKVALPLGIINCGDWTGEII